jgi:hypothetical protein
VAGIGVLIRPHPANAGQWHTLDTALWPNVAIWPPVGSDPNSPDFHRDYFDSLHHSAAVVGINTSAQLEAGIVGRPVFTVRAPEFEHSQTGTLHFQHLVNPDAGLVQSASTLDDHVAQLGAMLRGDTDPAAANRRFVRSFIRPFGEDTPAVPIFAGAVEQLAALPKLAPQPQGWWMQVARPFAYVVACAARVLAEDRPLWVYAMRPFVTAGVWSLALAARVANRRRQLGSSLRRASRRAHVVRYEGSQRASKATRRATKTFAARVRGAGVAVKRVARRAGLVPANAGRKQ